MTASQLAWRGAAALDEGEIAIGLDADQEGGARDNGRGLRGDVAPSLGFEGAGEEVEAVGASGEAAEIGLEDGDALVVGDGGGQGFVEGLVNGFADLEAVLGVAGKPGQDGVEAHLGFDTASDGGLAEEVGDHGAGLDVVGAEPAFDGLRVELEAELHAVGLELLDFEGSAAEDFAGLFALHQQGGGLVGAGGGGGLGGEGDVFEGGGGELEGIAADDGAAGVGDLEFDGESGEGGLPIGGAGDEAEVGGLAGAVDAAIGEEVGGELLRGFFVLDAAGIEAGEIERAVRGLKGHEGEVGILLRQDHERRFLALELDELGEAGAAAVFGGGGEDGLAVASDGFDAGAIDGEPGVDGLDEDVAGAVLGLLDDEAEIGDEDEAGVFDAGARILLLAAVAFGVGVGGHFFLRGGYDGADAEEEESLVGLAAEVAGEIDGVVGGLAGLLAGVIADFKEALHHLVGEARADVGPAELVHDGGDVLELVGEDAADFDFDVGDVARQVADLFIAGEGEEGALA